MYLFIYYLQSLFRSESIGYVIKPVFGYEHIERHTLGEDVGTL
jgi:hypothetical protein